MSSPSPGQAVQNLADSDPPPSARPVAVERTRLGYLLIAKRPTAVPARRRFAAVLAGLGLLALALVLYALATLARR